MKDTDAEAVQYHLPPPALCQFAHEHMPICTYEAGLLGRLANLLFPYRICKYPGKSKAFADALGYAPGSTRLYVKRLGDARLTLPVIGAAEKIIARYQAELTAISAGLALKRRELEAKPKQRAGFFAMRVKRTRQNDQAREKF